MGLHVFSLTIYLRTIVRIHILYRIIIIKSEAWPICHCLGLGHETMVCAVCLSMFLLLLIITYDIPNHDSLCLLYGKFHWTPSCSMIFSWHWNMHNNNYVLCSVNHNALNGHFFPKLHHIQLHITSTNVDLSSAWSSDNDLKAISQQVPKLSFCIMSLKFILLNLLQHLPGANDLTNSIMGIKWAGLFGCDTLPIAGMYNLF